MTITQATGGGAVIAEDAAKDAIKDIIDQNLAIRTAVDTLVANSIINADDDKEPHREKAVFAVYNKNPLFQEAVKVALDDLI
jgi:hypothetical protein